MKKSALLLLLLPMFMWQCTPGPSKTELLREKDSLLLATAEKEIMINRFIENLGEIEENLRIIKEKENIISIQAEQGDVKGHAGEQINQDIQLIYELMLKNKERIQELEKQAKSAGANNTKLNKLIANMELQLKEQAEQILVLQEQLAERDVIIGNLSQELIGLSYSMDSLHQVSEATRAQLNQTTDEKNTAWYAVGTRSELKSRSIITRDGFLFFGDTKVLKQDFDKQYFNKVDIRTVSEFPLYASKVKVLTSHPEGSFELANGQEGTLVLYVKDADAFWSISKYLVVQTN
mgnify:FL=1